MKILYKDILPPFIISDQKVNLIVTEHRHCYYDIIKQIKSMSRGEEGDIVLSEKEKILNIAFNVEVITELIPLEINSKKLLSALYYHLSKKSVNEIFYEKSKKLMGEIEKYMYELCEDEDADITFDCNKEMTAIFKALDMKLGCESGSLCEQLTEYFISVDNMLGEKLFVIPNLLEYIDDDEAELFFKTVTMHKIKLLLLEGHDIPTNPLVNKIIIDKDLCII